MRVPDHVQDIVALDPVNVDVSSPHHVVLFIVNPPPPFHCA